MRLTNWRGARPGKQDIIIAKNYLNKEELGALNNIVEQYLIFAEGQAKRRVPMYMKDWVKKLHGFLTLNDRNILEHARKISHDLAVDKAKKEYEMFRTEQLRSINEDDVFIELEKSLMQKGGEK